MNKLEKPRCIEQWEDAECNCVLKPLADLRLALGEK
jgi:hypothetical protein